MGDPEQDEIPAPVLRSIQIVLGTLVLGVIFLAVIASVIRMRDPAPLAPNPPLISYIAMGMVPLILIVRALVVPVFAKAGRRKLLAASPVTTKQLVEQFTARTIVGSALLEGSAFLLLVAYLVEGQSWTLIGAVAMAGLLVDRFPTR